MNVTEDGETSDKKRVHLDTILQEEQLGQFGRYQAKTIALLCVLVVFVSFSASEYIFSTARISTRCLIAECESLSDQPQFSPPWLENALPPSGSGSGFDNCNRYANTTAIIDVVDDTCPASFFDRDITITCDQYLYENTDTVVYDYDLACDEWRRTLIGSVRTLGTLTALPIAGFVSDRWGRRTILVVSSFNTAWIGILRYFADTYIGFVVSEFMEATFGSGGFSSAYILVMELVGPKYRVAAGTSMNTFFAVGQVLMGLIAWGVPNWRLFTITLYVPQFLTIIYFWLIYESVRWCLSKGRYEQAENVLKEIARVNKKKLSDKSLQALRDTAIEDKKNQELEKKNRKNEPWLIVLVFRHKPILIRCLTSPVWWITMTFIYYGLSINSVNLSGNRYLNYMAVAAVEIPGYWTSFLLLDRIGRRPVLSGGFFVCAACQIGYIFLPTGQEAVALALYLIGKFSIAGVVTAIYVYTAELYPTRHRHILFAFSSMMGRIGSILAPLTPALGAAVWEELPFALFALLALVSGLLVLVTPETLGAALPDTMEEAANIGRNKNQS